jgi:putative pyruvate formate lyase activating enzyme
MSGQMKSLYSNTDRSILEECKLCPRECGVNRFDDELGYCGVSAGFNIASVCIHRGEEPVISGKEGICNVFFRGCNLRCSYCQNYEISRPSCDNFNTYSDLYAIIDQIIAILEQGIRTVGFVSPSHVVPQMKVIIKELHTKGFRPVIVYNTNSYDKVSTLKSLEGLVDVYLPDFKYVTGKLAAEYSDAADYPVIALKALKEMYYQKGSTLRTGDLGNAENGLLIRHLVLPGHAEESKLLLKTIAEELSTGVNISLMSQYHPTQSVIKHPDLGRSLYREEYESVVAVMEGLGFRNGWTQNMESYLSYRPDFSREHPFE